MTFAERDSFKKNTPPKCEEKLSFRFPSGDVFPSFDCLELQGQGERKAQDDFTAMSPPLGISPSLSVLQYSGSKLSQCWEK